VLLQASTPLNLRTNTLAIKIRELSLSSILSYKSENSPVTQLWFVQVHKTDWIPHSSASKTNEEFWGNILIRKELRRAEVFFSFVREITLQPAHRLSSHPPV
jgi:hypothetical protein